MRRCFDWGWAWVALVAVVCQPALAAEEVERGAVADALRRAVTFFHDQVAAHNGYVYQVTSDLKYREGEGDAGQSSVWVQPPGTPAVGQAYIEAYERTGDDYLLAAAKDTAACLLQGQLHSGGWQNHIDFDTPLREKLAYRVDGPRRKRARNWSSFDDDQTQAALRFLMKVDRALNFKEAAIHEAVEFALAGVIRNQYPNGAWAQGFEEIDGARDYPDLPASYPESWPRKHPGGDYWQYYTLNDQALVRVMQTMWLAGEIYNQQKYRDSAIKAGNFLLQAQMPEPQPAWAQQYNFEMQPIWARKFEPAAVSGGESQVVIEALMDLAIQTGDIKYLAPVPRALKYLQSSLLPDGRLARFYELKTNRPLYFTKQYELTYDDSDMPTHYGFKTNSMLAKLQARYDKLEGLSSTALKELAEKDRQRQTRGAPNSQAVKKIISALDQRGAWVEPGKLRYIKTVPADQPMILSEIFIRNIEQLSRYLAATK
jgi:PelA/Pel-15E family pectate lyase